MIYLNTTSNISFIPSNSHITALVDSGASSHYVTANAPVCNIKNATSPIQVGLPNGDMLSATQTATLPLNTLPSSAQEAYIVPGMNKNLLSIGKLCDADCTAIFTKNMVQIKKENHVILEGQRNPTHGLWEVPLLHQQCNMTYHSRNTRDMIKFMHAALGSPTISTLMQAIRNGYLKTWPGLTGNNVTKHIDFNDATMKGHLDRVRKNLRSTSKDEGEEIIVQESKT